jgi:hypothetical protein
MYAMSIHVVAINEICGRQAFGNRSVLRLVLISLVESASTMQNRAEVFSSLGQTA